MGNLTIVRCKAKLIPSIRLSPFAQSLCSQFPICHPRFTVQRVSSRSIISPNRQSINMSAAPARHPTLAPSPAGATVTSMIAGLPRLLLARLKRAEQGIEPGLSGGLTEGMHHYYWGGYLFLAVQQLFAKSRALEAAHRARVQARSNTE